MRFWQGFKTLAILPLLIWFLGVFAVPAQAEKGSVLGIHILNTGEIPQAQQLLQADQTDSWHYVTIPLSLDDIQKHDEWQNFFWEAKKARVIPVVRLVTKFENGSWKVPTKRNITDVIKFLSDLEWPTAERHIIVFNEVNHAKEWGGAIDPDSYAETLRFTSQWAHSEEKNYIVLPAAMDLAATTGGETLEAFAYLDKMYQTDNEIFSYVDVWNSHSYPNPGFSASPERTAKNSLRGFQYELAYVKEKTGRDLQTFITETGWAENGATRRWLDEYYKYAAEHVWSDPRVIAVTPFILRGDPGPFSMFTFLDKNNKPTTQYQAYAAIIRQFGEQFKAR